MNKRHIDDNKTPEQNIQMCTATPFLYAHAYVPFQYMSCIYPPMDGLKQGTIFPELDRPYGLDAEFTIDE